MNEAAYLTRTRDMLAAIGPGEWTRVHDVEGAFVEAQGDMPGERIAIARFRPEASEDEIAFMVEAPRMVRFLLALVDRAIRAARSSAPREAGGGGSGEARDGGGPSAQPDRHRKDYAAQAAMACSQPAFKRFLMERHGLESPATDERTAQKLRSLLGVTSRRELNHGGAAEAGWKSLYGEFENWKRAG